MDFNSMINKLLKSRSETRKRNMCKYTWLQPRKASLTWGLDRHSHLCCYAAQRRMWYAGMGVKYDTLAKHPHQRIRASRCEDICETPTPSTQRRAPADQPHLVYRNLHIARCRSQSGTCRIRQGLSRLGLASLSPLRIPRVVLPDLARADGLVRRKVGVCSYSSSYEHGRLCSRVRDGVFRQAGWPGEFTKEPHWRAYRLGDRHGENILFDSTTGDTLHVDFNCLFEKVSQLAAVTGCAMLSTATCCYSTTGSDFRRVGEGPLQTDSKLGGRPRCHGSRRRFQTRLRNHHGTVAGKQGQPDQRA